MFNVVIFGNNSIMAVSQIIVIQHCHTHCVPSVRYVEAKCAWGFWGYFKKPVLGLVVIMNHLGKTGSNRTHLVRLFSEPTQKTMMQCLHMSFFQLPPPIHSCSNNLQTTWTNSLGHVLQEGTEPWLFKCPRALPDLEHWCYIAAWIIYLLYKPLISHTQTKWRRARPGQCKLWWIHFKEVGRYVGRYMVFSLRGVDLCTFIFFYNLFVHPVCKAKAWHLATGWCHADF